MFRNFIIGLAIFLSISTFLCQEEKLSMINNFYVIENGNIKNTNEDSKLDNVFFSSNERILQSDKNENPNDGGSNNMNSKTEFDSTNQIAIPETSLRWNSTLSYQDRQKYENLLRMKKSFAANLPFLPSAFKPEDPVYKDEVAKVALVFIGVSIVVLVLIFIFLILRFCCKKCVGPVKISQITRAYRNITWLIMIGSLISLIVVYIILLTYSFKINNAVRDSTNLIIEDTKNIKEVNLPGMYNLTQSMNNLDTANFASLKLNLEKYVNRTVTRNENSMNWEDNRLLASILIFLFYLIIAGLSFVGFFKHWANFLLALSIILLFSLPLLIFFEGITASYYFIYSDLCQAVHDAIYENSFPIDNRGLGFLISCFNAETRSNLHTFRYQVDDFEDDVRSQIAGNTSSSQDFEKYIRLQKEISDVKEKYLNPLIQCDQVYNNVEFFEQRFCLNGMQWTNDLMSSYSWLFLIIFVCSIAINRLKPLVEKKKSEIESMMENEDAFY